MTNKVYFSRIGVLFRDQRQTRIQKCGGQSFISPGTFEGGNTLGKEIDNVFHKENLY